MWIFAVFMISVIIIVVQYLLLNPFTNTLHVMYSNNIEFERFSDEPALSPSICKTFSTREASSLFYLRLSHLSSDFLLKCSVIISSDILRVVCRFCIFFQVEGRMKKVSIYFSATIYIYLPLQSF